MSLLSRRSIERPPKARNVIQENRALSLQELNAETFRLYGRMAIVTGAATGIGRAIAHKFAANGASVCLLDISRTNAARVEAEIIRAGGTASAYECDVSDRVSIGSTFHTISRKGQVHILVNNAGVSQIGTVRKHNRARLRPRSSRERKRLLQLYQCCHRKDEVCRRGSHSKHGFCGRICRTG